MYGFLATPGIEVQNLMFAGDEVVWLSWRYAAEECVPSLRHTNEVIGAYVTAGARIHLYRYLNLLQERVIYCDTDSVIFIQPRDEPWLIQTGDKLGDMTSELKSSEYTAEFVSGGHKNYAYRVIADGQEDKTVCKLRGITLNYHASRLVNCAVIKNMILGKGEPTVNLHTEKD